MRLGICAGVERLPEAAEAGFAFAEIAVHGLMAPPNEAAFAPLAKRLRAAPLPVEAANLFIPATVRVTGPDVDYPAVRRHMETALRRAGEVGVAVVVFGSGGARRLPEGFSTLQGWDQLIDAAWIAAEIGERHNVTVVMEPLFKRACNFFNHLDQGVGLVDRVGHPRLRLLADLFHMKAEGDSVYETIAAGQWLEHVHLPTPSLPETGEGPAYEFAAFFAALRKAGYDGRVSVEDNPGWLATRSGPLTSVYRAIIAFLDRMKSQSESL